MKATNEQIKAEAKRRWGATPSADMATVEDFIIEVMRENWTPPEPVDPDLIEVLALLFKRHPGSNYYYAETGKTDALTQTCLAAYKAGREKERARAKVLVENIRDPREDIRIVALAKYNGEA